MTIEINGVAFQVGVLNLKREFNIEEKYRITTENGKKHREIRGIYKCYTLTVGNIDEDIYDSLIEVLTSTDEYQKVKLPYGKTGFTEYEAMFESISDELMYERGGKRYWTNLSIKFTARETGGA